MELEIDLVGQVVLDCADSCLQEVTLGLDLVLDFGQFALVLGDNMLEGLEVVILLLASLKPVFEALALFTQLVDTGFKMSDVGDVSSWQPQSGRPRACPFSGWCRAGQSFWCWWLAKLELTRSCQRRRGHVNVPRKVWNHLAHGSLPSSWLVLEGVDEDPCWVCFLVRPDCATSWGFGADILDLCNDDLIADARKNPCWRFGCSADFPSLEWSSLPLPLLELLGDSSALCSMRERKKAEHARDRHLDVVVPGTEVGPCGFPVLLADPDPVLATKASDRYGMVAGSGFVSGFLTAGAWQPNDCVIWVYGLAVFGAWVKVDAVGSGGGCGHGKERRISGRLR